MRLLNLKGKMKHLLTLLSVCGFVSMASAQNHLVQSFLADVRSIQASNLNQVTNLLATGSSTTNRTILVWTNGNGTRITGATSPGYNTLKDVALWSDRNGNYFPNMFNTFGPGSTNQVSSPMTVFIGLYGQNAAANSAVTFLFTPIWDASETSGFSGTDTYLATADQWSVAVTAAGTTPVTLATNVPLWRWPGAKYLRLERISNGDSDADSQVWINRVVLSGFRP